MDIKIISDIALGSCLLGSGLTLGYIYQFAIKNPVKRVKALESKYNSSIQSFENAIYTYAELKEIYSKSFRKPDKYAKSLEERLKTKIITDIKSVETELLSRNNDVEYVNYFAEVIEDTLNIAKIRYSKN